MQASSLWLGLRPGLLVRECIFLSCLLIVYDNIIFGSSTSEERGQVIHCLYGNVHKLTRHAEASEIVEFAYNEYANKSQRTALVQEFYGSEFAVFKNPTSSSSSSQPEDLGELLAKHADKAKSILLHMRDSLLPLLDKYVCVYVLCVYTKCGSDVFMLLCMCVLLGWW